MSAPIPERPMNVEGMAAERCTHCNGLLHLGDHSLCEANLVSNASLSPVGPLIVLTVEVTDEGDSSVKYVCPPMAAVEMLRQIADQIEREVGIDVEPLPGMEISHA